MRAYLKMVAGEFALAGLVACSLSYLLLDAFNTAEWLQFGPLPAVLCLACMAGLYLLGFNGRSLRMGAPLFLLLCVGIWGAGLVSSGSAWLVDDANNKLICALVCTLTPVCVYVLSRWRAGAALVFIVGAALLLLIQFFYEGFWLAWSAAFLAGSLALLVLRNYRNCVERAISAEGVRFGVGFCVAAGAALLTAVLACGVWFVAIAPLNPGAFEIKLITVHKSLENKSVHGTSEEYQLPNTDLTATETNELARSTDDLQIDQANGTPQGANAEASEVETATSSGQSLGVDLDSLRDNFDVKNLIYELKLAALVAAVLLAVLAVAYFLGRRAWRRRRLARAMNAGPRAAVLTLFPYLLGLLAKLGFGLAPGRTLTEHARLNSETLAHYTVDGVSFAAITAAYERAAYSEEPVPEEDAEQLAAFYLNFWRATRQHLGTRRYFLKSWRL